MTRDLSSKRRRGRRGRGGVIALTVVVVFFALVHWAGGAIAKRVLNHKLAQMQHYTGEVGAVRLALWRGAADVENFVLRERDKPNEPPLVQVRLASFSAAFAPLLQGRLGGDGVVEGARILFVKHHAFAGPKDAAEKIGAEVEEKTEQAVRWQAALRRALPVELARLEVKNSHVRYIDRAHQPNVDVEISDLAFVLTGLQNPPEANPQTLPTRLVLSGTTTGNGRLKLQVDADPSAAAPRFVAAFELRALELPAMNTLLRAYVGADVSRGAFEMFSEIEARDGRYAGYVKPVLRELDFRNVEDRDKNLAQRAKEKVVSAVSSLLQNDEEQKVATVTPFSGTFAGGQVGVWETVHHLLRNAFVQALREGFESQKPAS
jgi:hypothetical protein